MLDDPAFVYDFDGENFIDRATGEIVPSEPTVSQPSEPEPEGET